MSSFKKKLLIVFFVLIAVAVGGGIFWLGKKSGEKVSSNISQKIAELEHKNQQLKNQLQTETNPTKQQELKDEIKSIEQQIQNLGGSKKPHNPNRQNPPKTSRQWTVKCNGALVGRCWYINVANAKEQISIDTKNKVFYSNDALSI